MTKEEILQQCTINENIIKLPDVKLDRKVYLEVAKSLELIGGKWKGGKVAGFIFPNDPTDLFQKLIGGEKIEKENLKKKFQFFPTPPDIADWLVTLADLKDGDLVLEPSAGQGAIIDAIYRAFPRYMMKSDDKPSVAVDYYELMDINKEVLSKKINADRSYSSRTSIMGSDFLLADEKLKYNKIIANPPFSKNQDINHIYKMWKCLKKGGRLVSIASNHWRFSKNKKEVAFKNWVEENGTILDIERGSFKESGTMIECCVIIINK